MDCSGDIVSNGTLFKFIQEPESGLGKGEGCLRTVISGNRRDRGYGETARGFGQAGRGRLLKNGCQGKLNPESPVDGVDQAGGQKAVPAKGEEIVMDADPPDFQDGAENGAQSFLFRRFRRNIYASCNDIRLREPGAVDFTARGEGNGVNGREEVGDHVIRKVRGEMRAQFTGVEIADYPGAETLLAFRTNGIDNGVPDARVGSQQGLDFTRFDAVAADLDLLVDAAEKFHVAVG